MKKFALVPMMPPILVDNLWSVSGHVIANIVSGLIHTIGQYTLVGSVYFKHVSTF